MHLIYVVLPILVTARVAQWAR